MQDQGQVNLAVPPTIPEPNAPKGKPRTVGVRLSVRRYDVWGNWREGYEVNDTRSWGECETDVCVDCHGIPTLRSILRKVRACGIDLPYGLTEDQNVCSEDTVYLNTRTGKPWGEIYVEPLQGVLNV